MKGIRLWRFQFSTVLGDTDAAFATVFFVTSADESATTPKVAGAWFDEG